MPFIDTTTVMARIIDVMQEKADTFAFIVRDTFRLEERGRRLIRDLEDHLLIHENVSEWPGTKLLWNQYATIYKYSLNNDSAAILCDSSVNLTEWISPAMPEDLIFYVKDKALFVSITHENVAYLDLEVEDVSFFRNTGLI